MSAEERGEIKKVAHILLERLKTVLTLDWRKRVDARARVRLAIEDILDEGLPRAYTPESVYFVKDNHRIRACLDKDYPQKHFVAGGTLRNQDSDIWIIPKDAYPLDQGRRHVEITFRMSIGEESFVDRIEKLL